MSQILQLYIKQFLHANKTGFKNFGFVDAPPTWVGGGINP